MSGEPFAPSDPGLMTPAEHRAVELLGQAFNTIATEVIGDGPTRGHDVAELAARIHDLQHLVMAQAAARAYPDRYRLAGQVGEWEGRRLMAARTCAHTHLDPTDDDPDLLECRRCGRRIVRMLRSAHQHPDLFPGGHLTPRAP